MTRSRAVAALCACQAALSFGLGLAFPFFAIYLHDERALSVTWAGAWLSISVAVSALSQGYGGPLSDRLGRRRVLSFSLWARASTVLVLSAAVLWRWPLPLLIALHVVSSLAAGLFEPAARGWVADHSEGAARHRAFGWLRAATHGGFALGPALGGFLAHRSYALAFAASAAVCALCALGAAWLPRDDGRPGAAPLALSSMRPPRDARFLRLCAANGLLAVATAHLVVPLSLYATRSLGLSSAQVGLLLALNGALIVLLQVPVTHALAGTRLSTVLVAGSILYAAGFGAVGAAAAFGGVAAAVVLITAGEILVPAGAHTLAANMAPARERGRWLGFLGLTRQAGSAFGPLAGCAGIEAAALHGLGHEYWFVVGALGLACAAGFHAVGRGLGAAEQGLSGELDDADDLPSLV